jgi:hypothetical protein
MKIYYLFGMRPVGILVSGILSPVRYQVTVRWAEPQQFRVSDAAPARGRLKG